MTPLFDSLESAAKALVRDPEYNRREMHLHHWATTYRCSIDDVNQALDIAENGRRKLPEEVAAAAPRCIPTDEETEE
jgi:hypothetical protein